MLLLWAKQPERTLPLFESHARNISSVHRLILDIKLEKTPTSTYPAVPSTHWHGSERFEHYGGPVYRLEFWVTITRKTIFVTSRTLNSDMQRWRVHIVSLVLRHPARPLGVG
jgi:hypothetical protein